jgi:DNA helicase-2/ATP-dependent DNA helicase PcrA
MDFNDLLLHVLLLLRRNTTVKTKLQNRFNYVLVDEFQDTNRTQFELLRSLTEKSQNLFVVGDDDQSIYSWRGAIPANIIDFGRIFPGAKAYTLEQNYRCSANIVDAAAAMIAHNERRTPKKLFTHREPGDLIDYISESDGELEAYYVIGKIKEERHNFSLDEIAIFYRTNSQSRIFEEALRRENIPYTIYGSLEFYARMEIKDLLAYLRLLVNQTDEVSLRRIINVPTRGIGERAVDMVSQEALSKNISMFQAMENLADLDIPRVSTKLRYFLDLIQALQRDAKELPFEELLPVIIEAIDYPQFLKKKYPDQYLDKLDNISELGSAISDYCNRFPDADLASWLQSITLVQSEKDDQATKGVSLMTLHMAKGLEFRRVYVTGLEEGLLPHKNSLEDYMKIEEERRLLYVGMTRAKEKLTLTSAQHRKNFKMTITNSPSRFLREIPKQHLRFSSYERSSIDSDGIHYDYDVNQSTPSLDKGATVFHPTYGRGVVEEVDNAFGKPKVVVNFEDFGFRKISPSQLY